MDAKKLYALEHLSKIDIQALISDTSLYTPILIDTYSCKIHSVGRTERIEVSPDVKQLYSLLTIKDPICLPCAGCKKELAFSRLTSTDFYSKPRALVQVDLRQYQPPDCDSSDPSEYELYSNDMFIASDNKTKDYMDASIFCKNILLDKLSFFLVELSCSLNADHTIRCMFSLSPFTVDKNTELLYQKYRFKKLTVPANDPIILPQPEREPTVQEAEAKRLYEMAGHTLVLKKVGQSPSLSDMQFFNLQKYQTILKDRYQELTKACGLYSSGIGIGSFVYLRRIFETICEDVHQECIVMAGWDEAEYTKMHFNQRMEYFESFGKYVIPEALNPIKSKLYGVISKGVHEYSETECKELFPCIKTAIELILDQKLAEIEKKNKINELTKVIGSAKT